MFQRFETAYKWLLNGTVPPWLSYNSNLVVYLGSRPWANASSPTGTAAAGLSREIIHSVSFVQFLGEMVVVGSHLPLSWHNKHGQSTMDSIDVGRRLGKSLYVHLPPWSSFSRRIKPFFSSFRDTLEPSLLLAESSRHKSD